VKREPAPAPKRSKRITTSISILPEIVARIDADHGRNKRSRAIENMLLYLYKL
jgi:hypothetical protein